MTDRSRPTILLAIVFALFAASGSAQLPFQLRENFVSGLSSPVFLTNAGDGTRRLFIVQQRGIIKVVQPGSTSPTDYLNLSTLVSNSGNERGLLGLAFHPNFESNRRFFVYYTRQTGTNSDPVEIAEYTQNAANPNLADAAPVRVIISIPHPGQTNHNGGTVAFGPDGYLYAGLGDGGSGNDPNANAQNLNSLLGKVLRLDIDTLSPPLNYSIPPTNPLAGATPGADEIYAYGLRNPYRFSFDRGGTNTLWVGDVGQNAIEEVDNIVSGGNYGWRVYEGGQCTNNDPQLCSTGATPISSIPPIFQYTRVLDTSGQNRCSVTGGYVYRGKQNALPVGAYVYADYCTGEIMLWNGSQQTILSDTSNNNFVSFGEDEDGEIYVVRQHLNFVANSGSIARIAGARTNSDFDGDGATDLSVYRPAGGIWYWYNPLTNGGTQIQFGLSTDRPVSEDYDGDGKTDIAVFRPSTGVWYILRSSDSTVQYAQWGISTDIPAVGDFTGDRRADVAVYRPEEGRWYIQRSGTGLYDVFNFGLAEDQPVNGDFDGDGRNDVTVWRPSDGVWWRINSSNGAISAFQFGQPGDVPAQADYDGDGRTDEALYRPSAGTWFINQSLTSTLRAMQFGISEDIPVPGDYDRDGRDDIAVYRPSSGAWWVTRSTDLSYFAFGFGLAGDIPGPSVDHP
ncbi:MAG: PQQ-dependent sugar dehydrogenase [Pyrinomonadaceae bacterium]